jgi:O-antigen/teichoic acid export membrane protein
LIVLSLFGLQLQAMVNFLTAWSKNLNFAHLSRLGSKVAFAIIDQALFSGSNFVLNILLVRWLSANEYGAFSMAFVIYLFFSGFHNALVLEPMSVLATSKYTNELLDYVSGQVNIHFLLTTLAGLLVACGGAVFLYHQMTYEYLATSLVGVGLFLPLLLLMWLARRSCYILGMPGLSLTASLIYSVTLIGGAVCVHEQFSSVNAIKWFFLLGTASLAGSLVVYGKLKMMPFRRRGLDWIILLKEQLVFGKWIVLAAFLNFVAAQIQLFITAMYLGLDQAGVFRAAQNFMLPMLQVLTAVSTLSLPSVAFEFGRQAFGNMRNKSFRVGSILVIISLLYIAALYVFGDSFEQFLYSGKFSQFSSLIPVMGVIPLITAFEVSTSLIVRSLQRPIYHAVWTGIMALVAVIFGIWMTQLWGVVGAVYSLIVVALASLAINYLFYRKWFIAMLAGQAVKS